MAGRNKYSKGSWAAAFFTASAFFGGSLHHNRPIGGALAFSQGPGSCDAGVPLQGSHLLNEQLGGGPLSDNGFQVRINGATLDSDSTNELAVLAGDATHDLQLVASGADAFFRGFLIRIDGENVDTRDYLDVPEGNTDIQVVSLCVLIEDVGGVAHTSNSEKTQISALLRLPEPATGLAMDVTMVVQNRDGNAEWYNSRYTIDAVEGLETQPPTPSSKAPTFSPAPSPVPTTSPMPSVSPNPTSIIESPTASPPTDGSPVPSSDGDGETTTPSDSTTAAPDDGSTTSDGNVALVSMFSKTAALILVASWI